MYDYIALFVAIIIFNILRGVGEGIDMYKTRVVEGARHHRYYKYYHRIDIMTMFAAALIGALINRTFEPTVYYVLFMSGSFILSWQMFEGAYSYTRFYIMFPETENFLGTGKRLNSTLVSLVRVTIGLIMLFLSCGGIK